MFVMNLQFEIKHLNYGSYGSKLKQSHFYDTLNLVCSIVYAFNPELPSKKPTQIKTDKIVIFLHLLFSEHFTNTSTVYLYVFDWFQNVFIVVELDYLFQLKFRYGASV